MGALVASRLPANPIGWIFCGMGLLYGARRLAAAYADYALLYKPLLPMGEYAAWSITWLGFPALATLGVFLVLLFPDGRLPSRRWRAVAWAAVCGATMVSLGEALRFGPLPAYFFVHNPLGVPGATGEAGEGLGGLPARGLPEASAFVGGALLCAGCVVSAVAPFIRLRRAGREERRQLGWFALAAVPGVLGAAAILLDRTVERFSLLFLNETVRPVLWLAERFSIFVREDRELGPLAELRLDTTFEFLTVLGLFFVPVFTSVAILRHRLYDVDGVVNRTLVYGALTAVVVAFYVLLVALLGALFRFGAGGNLAVSLVATGVVAALFGPLRDRLQRGVDRLMYGERHDPYAALSRLGRRLEATLAPEDVLPTIVETVAGALKVPHAAVALKEGDGFRTAASRGTPAGVPAVVPLAHGKEEVGRLVVSPRSPGEPFSPADRGLLEDLARQAGVAVHAARLTADLQRSRERLVAAREEERRRLRRDLHDGLGPTLAGLTYGLDAASKLAKEEPEGARKLLGRLKAQAGEAVADVRRLVYGLRPPALDDLGLVPALRRQAAAHAPPEGAGGGEAGPVFAVEAPVALPPLPAAVEVACYRIAQEAMTNAARHSGATTCRVRLSADAERLELEVTDDGTGITDDRGAGLGLSSMRERAAELGGTCAVEAPPTGGTRVLARLPLEASGVGRREMPAARGSSIHARRAGREANVGGMRDVDRGVHRGSFGGPDRTAYDGAEIGHRREQRAEGPSLMPGASKIRVLVADDHAIFREGLRAMLGSEPDTEVVGEATTGAEAVRMAADLAPDAVLMDLQMPGINGIEATRRVVAADPGMGVVMLTMFEDDDSVFSAMRAGARGYVLKGADPSEVLDVLRSVAGGEARFGPEIARRIVGFLSAPANARNRAEAFPELTAREREVLDLIARGRPNPEIARDLFLSPKTVRNHISHIFAKLRVADRAQAIVRAREAGLGGDEQP